ncbi:MAG: methyltransferase domain-containing protein [Actinobacteria bacterium]|nr:methyltransferase domain-containing protein [Actinomycetota bacterium]
MKPSHFENEAERWTTWARTPGHDAFWDYSPTFFEEIVPAAGRTTLEIGCGEGRVTRDLSARGHTVVAVDSSPTLLRYAAKADAENTYLLADASSLPFSNGAFDLVVAYNVLMDVADMSTSVAEASRVLESGGRLCICVSHPMNGPGAFAGEEPDAPFVITGSYLESHPLEETLERDGLSMTFAGLTHSLEAYARSFETAGLLIETMREPRPIESAATAAREKRWGRVPMFLFVKLIKPR